MISAYNRCPRPYPHTPYRIPQKQDNAKDYPIQNTAGGFTPPWADTKSYIAASALSPEPHALLKSAII